MRGRACDLSQLTADAKSVLQEMESEARQQQLDELLEMARRDPAAPYRRKKWYPRFVVWELTLACNMRCKHCGSSAGQARPDELTLDEMLRVCDQLAELGCERVTLLGGEPLIHPHWFDVAQRVRQNGYSRSVITNGWTLHSEELCDRIKEAGFSIVGISVDGMGASHDRLRCRPGAFERLRQGMALLRAREVTLGVATVITTESLRELEALHAFLVDNDVRVWQLQIASPLGRFDRDNPLIIKPRQVRELYDFVWEKRAGKGNLRLDIADNVGYYGHDEIAGIRQKKAGDSCIWTGCHAGIQGLGLDSNGNVKGCQSLPSTPQFIEGNVRERSLEDIWNDPEAFAYTRAFERSQLKGFCARCQFGPLCKAGCTSTALSHSGDMGDNPMCLYRAEFEQG